MEAALKANPDYDLYHGDIRSYRSTLAACQAGTGKFGEALATAEGIEKLGWEAKSDAFMAACAYSSCVAALEGQAGLSAERRAEQSRLFSERAIAALRLAVAKGFSEIRHVKEDEDLRPLRDRKDFQELVAEMGNKAGKGK